MDGAAIWIEAEHWAPGQWNEVDDITDVIVTLADGTRWVATFGTYANVQALTVKHRQTGECLAGTYLWVSDMVLIDRLTRPRIEAVIEHLQHTDAFTRTFSLLPPSPDTTD